MCGDRFHQANRRGHMVTLSPREKLANLAPADGSPCSICWRMRVAEGMVFTQENSILPPLSRRLDFFRGGGTPKSHGTLATGGEYQSPPR